LERATRKKTPDSRRAAIYPVIAFDAVNCLKTISFKSVDKRVVDDFRPTAA
jgi:hypothetical protein